MKKVSVIIPTYNRANYLKSTLESVVNQTYTNLEVLVIDDGSPNAETEELCENYKSVKYYKIENSGGPATPRNVGIRNATGEFLAFVDDDDIWLPHKIEEQIKILSTQGTFGLVHCCCSTIDENGNLKDEIIGRPGQPSVKHGDVKLRMMGNWTLMMPTPLMRRSLIDEVGLFNTDIPPALEDVEFWTRCSFYTNFYYIDEPLVQYRVHESNISASNKNYIDLPLYLKIVLKNQLKSARITKSEYNQLLNNLCFSQAKSIKTNVKKTLSNLFELNPFWIVNFRVLKVITKKLIA